MARNKYPGRCYCCGPWVEPGYGHLNGSEMRRGVSQSGALSVSDAPVGGYLRIRTPVWYGPRRRRGKRGKHETGISAAAPEAA